MLRQNFQQLYFRVIDSLASDASGEDDGVRLTSETLKYYIISELTKINCLENKYDFIGDKYLVCPRDISEIIQNEFFNDFPFLKLKFRKILGKFNLDIAYQYITVYSGDTHRQSLLWHHDSVGHRLKVFVPLYSTTLESSLFWEQGTSKKYKAPIYGENRTNYTPLNIVNEFGDIPNEILILNTNTMHSGNPNIPKGQVRNVFVMEFSNIFKSYIFATRVGVRNEV